MTNSMDKDRIFGTVGLNIDFTKNLTLDIRTGLDMNNEFRTQRKPFYSYNYPQSSTITESETGRAKPGMTPPSELSCTIRRDSIVSSQISLWKSIRTSCSNTITAF